MIQQLVVISLLVQFAKCEYQGFRQQNKKNCYNKCYITNCFDGEKDENVFIKCIKYNLKCNHRSSLCENYECFNECKQKGQQFQDCYKCLNACNEVVDECKINQDYQYTQVIKTIIFIHFYNVSLNKEQTTTASFLNMCLDIIWDTFLDVISELLAYLLAYSIAFIIVLFIVLLKTFYESACE